MVKGRYESYDMAIKMVEFFWLLLKVHPDLVQKQQNKQGKTNGRQVALTADSPLSRIKFLIPIQ